MKSDFFWRIYQRIVKVILKKAKIFSSEPWIVKAGDFKEPLFIYWPSSAVSLNIIYLSEIDEFVNFCYSYNNRILLTNKFRPRSFVSC